MTAPESEPAAPVRLAVRLWRSPSAATAASVGARAFALFAPVPFLTAQFSDSVVALWFVFMTFQSLVAALNGTLPVVFMHMVSYARAGSASLGGFGDAHADAARGEPNWPLLGRVCQMILIVFAGLAGVWLVLAASVGAAVIWTPVARTGLGGEAWIAWAVFAAGGGLRIAQQGYVAYLLGFGEIVPVRRLEALSWFVGGLGATLVLWLAPGFLAAVVLLQLPLAANLVIFYQTGRLSAAQFSGAEIRTFSVIS